MNDKSLAKPNKDKSRLGSQGHAHSWRWWTLFTGASFAPYLFLISLFTEYQAVELSDSREVFLCALALSNVGAFWLLLKSRKTVRLRIALLFAILFLQSFAYSVFTFLLYVRGF